MASARTTDHDEIRTWAETRGGSPARVKATARGKAASGILRIDYPGFRGAKSLERISWDAWFDAFEKTNLELVYDTSKNSRFSRLVSRMSNGRAAQSAARATPERARRSPQRSSRGATAPKARRTASKRAATKGKTTLAKAPGRTAQPRTSTRQRASAKRAGSKPLTKRGGRTKRSGAIAKRRPSSRA